MKLITDKNMKAFAKIKENEWFEYYTDRRDNVFIKDKKPLVGFKIDEKYVAFINCNMMFIAGKVYNNCISIGSHSIEFYSFYDLINVLATNLKNFEEKCKL